VRGTYPCGEVARKIDWGGKEDEKERTYRRQASIELLRALLIRGGIERNTAKEGETRNSRKSPGLAPGHAEKKREDLNSETPKIKRAHGRLSGGRARREGIEDLFGVSCWPGRGRRLRGTSQVSGSGRGASREKTGR